MSTTIEYLLQLHRDGVITDGDLRKVIRMLKEPSEPPTEAPSPPKTEVPSTENKRAKRRKKKKERRLRQKEQQARQKCMQKKKNECLKWALLSLLYPYDSHHKNEVSRYMKYVQYLNMEGIVNFPTPVSQIKSKETFKPCNQ